MARASGESSSACRLRRHAAITSSAEPATVKIQAKPSERWPAGSARLAVRGLRRSNSMSAMRFMVMAAERAPTMATTIHRVCCHEGKPPAARAASRAPTRAKGSAKTECSNLIISSTTRMRDFVMAGSRVVHFRIGHRDTKKDRFISFDLFGRFRKSHFSVANFVRPSSGTDSFAAGRFAQERGNRTARPCPRSTSAGSRTPAWRA